MQTDPADDAMAIFRAGLDAADPERAVLNNLQKQAEGVFSVAGQSLDLDQYGRVFVVGAGKAACPMARALERALPRVTGGRVTTKYGHCLDLERIEVTEAGHPTPDENGVKGAQKILDILNGATDKDIVFCVISGGGSALMPLPAEGLTLAQKQEATSALLACGASIHEINAIRKHISRIKGGGLARAAHPARLVSFVLSDVIGDDLDVIASGPTVPDSGTFAQCMEVVRRRNLQDVLPREVVDRLEQGALGKIPETPKPGDPIFANSGAVIVGSSRQSLFAARDKARDLGYNAMILSAVVEGETREVAKVHAAVIKEIAATRNPVAPPACVLSGGETTVTLRGGGRGGRNMEFALAGALEIAGIGNALIFSAGTDGTDGPTDAAGARADGDTAERARALGLDARAHLDGNDAYPFFKALDDLIVTGPTMTNVMDLRILLVR